MTTGIKYTTAYSVDLGMSITADDAYSYRSQGLISAPDAFICDSDGCKAKMVCANIDKLPNLRKREPHFRTSGSTESHDPVNCTYHQDHAQVSISYSEHEKKFTNRIKSDQANIIFLEKAPEYPPRRSSNIEHPLAHFNRSSSNGSGAGKPVSANKTRYSRIRPLVGRFLHMNDGQLRTQCVQIGDAIIPYSELFFELNSVRQVPESEKRIYYGMGYINLIGNNKLRLSFHYEQHFADTTAKPSVFISAEDIETYAEKKRLLEVIDKCLSADGRKIDLYVYSRPLATKDGRYINMPIASLDHIYFFPRNYADED